MANVGFFGENQCPHCTVISMDRCAGASCIRTSTLSLQDPNSSLTFQASGFKSLQFSVTFLLTSKICNNLYAKIAHSVIPHAFDWTSIPSKVSRPLCLHHKGLLAVPDRTLQANIRPPLSCHTAESCGKL